MYGHAANRKDILSGKVAVPPQANVLVKSIEKGAR
jgi:lipid-binding SYLF domain-containing protein